MITKQDLLETREQIQEDLMCLLDAWGEQTISDSCQIIVDRFSPLLTKIESINQGIK